MSRFAFVEGALKESAEIPDKEGNTLTDKLDSLLLNRFFGIPLFLGIMWVMFWATFQLGSPLSEYLEQGFSFVSSLLGNMLDEGWLLSLLQEGIIAGVGGVLSFVPTIMILFLFIAFLEDTGYMARAAFIC
jgi:ferrous iron transport protein B